MVPETCRYFSNAAKLDHNLKLGKEAKVKSLCRMVYQSYGRFFAVAGREKYVKQNDGLNEVQLILKRRQNFTQVYSNGTSLVVPAYGLTLFYCRRKHEINVLISSFNAVTGHCIRISSSFEIAVLFLHLQK